MTETGRGRKALAFGGPIAWIGMDGPEILFVPGETDGALSLRFSTPENYARALFHALRFLESSGAAVIVAQRPETEAGIALASGPAGKGLFRREEKRPGKIRLAKGFRPC
jgi:SUA5 domain.